MSNAPTPTRTPAPGDADAGLADTQDGGTGPNAVASITRSGITSTTGVTANLSATTRSGHTGSITGTGTGSDTATGTGPLRGQTGQFTGTILQPGLSSSPELQKIKGWRLDQILLATTVLLVTIVVSLLAAFSSFSTAHQLRDTAEMFKARLQAQARELGQTVSHTLSVTTAPSIRDNNFGFLDEVSKAIIADNPNMLRVQFFDEDLLSVADSDPNVPLGSTASRALRREYLTSNYNGKPVFEYQEPIDYGSAAGKGLVVLSYSLEPLQLQLQELEETNQKTLRTNITRTVALGAAFLLLAAILGAVQSRRVTRPLGVLHESVVRLSQGDLDTRIQEPKGAALEVKTLGAVFNHMADRISWLLEDVRAKALLEREMLLARTVQETMLPSRDPLQIGGLRIAGLVSTAEACGGDWWLRTALGPDRVVLGVGDVTGHGLSTALVATSATAGFAAAMKMRESADINAAMLITSLNRTLFHVARGEHQMSSALAVFNLQSEELEYVAGAHPSPLLYNRHDQKSGQLMARGALLGQADASTYTSRRQPLRPGDVVVWYTDGLTESRNAQGKQYGTQRLNAVLKQNANMPAEQLRDAILADVRSFCGEQPQDDDLTIVVAEYSPLQRTA